MEIYQDKQAGIVIVGLKRGENVYESLHKLFSRYAPPFKTSSGKIRAKRDFHLVVPKAVAVP